MQNSTINLCRLIILNNSEQIEDKNLAELYKDFYKQLEESIGYYYRRQNNSNEFTQAELEKLVDDHLSFVRDRISKNLSSRNLFNPHGLFSIDIEKIILRLTHFDFERNSLILNVYAISNDIKLRDVIGDFVVISLQTDSPSDHLNTASIKLHSDLFICKSVSN